MGLAARSAAEAAPAHTTALTAKAAEKIFKLFMSPPAKLIRNQFESEPYPLRKYRSSAFLGLTGEFGEVLHNRRKGRPGTQARKLKPASLNRRVFFDSSEKSQAAIFAESTPGRCLQSVALRRRDHPIGDIGYWVRTMHWRDLPVETPSSLSVLAQPRGRQPKTAALLRQRQSGRHTLSLTLDAVSSWLSSRNRASRSVP